MLVRWLHDPVNPCILPHGSVLGIDENHLEILIRRVLVDPVRVQHAQVPASATDSLLRHGAQVAVELELVDPLVLGLTVHDALPVRALAASAAHGDAVNDEPLLRFVSKTVCFVRAGRLRNAPELGQLTVFPCAYAQEETHDIALLLAPELFHILVATHVVLVLGCLC